jgi:hypothetical protein
LEFGGWTKTGMFVRVSLFINKRIALRNLNIHKKEKAEHLRLNN